MKWLIAIAMVSTMAVADCGWVMVVNPTTGDIEEVWMCD